MRDESDRQGMRLVIELKREASPRTVLNQLYKHTAMQTGVQLQHAGAGRTASRGVLTAQADAASTSWTTARRC